MKAVEFKELSNEELGRKLEDLRQSYMKLRFQHATAQLDSSAKIRGARKDIARALTALRQKSLAKG
ncbi:MAG: 50S ribosomal protein L29 [Nitrospinae bacterium]|nr:50S ribosomal protein L29 [Nitrospinota bacterium]